MWRLSWLIRSMIIAALAGVALAIPLTNTEVSIKGDATIETRPMLELPDAALADTSMGSTEWSEALARPLFSPDRRPFVPPASESKTEFQEEPLAVETAPAAGQVGLIGVFIHDTGRRALLTSPSSPRGEWLALGSQLEGWKVVRIDTNSVALSSSSGSLTLQLDVDKTPGE